jgi:hypothetical protein
VCAVLLAGCATATRTAPAKPRPTAPTAPAASSAARPATQVRLFTPFRPDGSPAVTVARTSSGSCWTTSIAAPVRRAYRCLTANQILDPCFVTSARATTALCLLNPWAPAQRLRLTAPLPKPVSTLEPSRPWALELGNGARCIAVTGTAPAAAGVSLAYSCGHGYGAALLTSRGRTMTAHYARAGASALRTVRVRVAWRA